MVLEKDPWYVRLFDIRLRKVYLCVCLFVKTLLGPAVFWKLITVFNPPSLGADNFGTISPI